MNNFLIIILLLLIIFLITLLFVYYLNNKQFVKNKHKNKDKFYNIIRPSYWNINGKISWNPPNKNSSHNLGPGGTYHPYIYPTSLKPHNLDKN